MGISDQIICEYPLPDNPGEEIQNSKFQTKSIDPGMHTYMIDKKGKFIAISHTMFKYNTEIPYTGSFIMYTYGGTHAEGWFEYLVKFEDGKLISIEVHEDEDIKG